MVPYLAQRSITSGRYDEAQLLGSPKYFEESLITQRLNARAEDLRALNVEGQAMEPLLRDGDLVLMDTQRTTLAEPGLLCCLMVKAWCAAGQNARLMPKPAPWCR